LREAAKLATRDLDEVAFTPGRFPETGMAYPRGEVGALLAGAVPYGDVPLDVP
jgi:hypothetical protein